MGIEPTLFAWEARVLPLNDTRRGADSSAAQSACPDAYATKRAPQYAQLPMTIARTDDLPASEKFLSGGGDTGRLLRAKQWQATALGCPADWPDGLRFAVRLMLHAHDPVVVVWGRDSLAFWNDAYRDLLPQAESGHGLGRPAAEILGTVWPDIAPHIQRVMKGEVAERSEFAGQRMNADGVRESGHWNCSYAPLNDEAAADGVAGVMKTCAWVPRHRQSLESRLLDTQDQLKIALAGSSGIGSWDWDVQTDRVFADASFAHLYGVPAGDAKFGAPIAQFFATIHSDDVGRVRKHIAHAVQTGAPFREEFRMVARNGGLRWLVAEGRCKHRADGAPLRFKGIAFDVTERKRMEQELLELSTDLESKVTERASERSRTWQVSPDLLGVCNRQGYFETSNPAWQKILGWSEAEIASKLFSDFVHPDDLANTLLLWQDVTTRGVPSLQSENRYQCKDGTYRWLSWVAVPEGDKIYCSARDITEEKERAEALVLAESALRQSQKMEAVGQLTGGLAHDFNNLLTTINGSLELIERSVAAGQPEKLERLLGMARGAVKRASSLTHRLLAFSRQQTLAPKSINVSQLVIGMEDMIRRTVEPSVHLQCTGEPGLWPTLADPGQLENALLNLCLNARDAMPDGGHLTVEARNRSIPAAAAGSPGLASGDYVSLCVADTGVGMPPEVVAKAFDPFFTTKPLGSGTGLGLSMVYGFAQQSGGQVRIHSEVGVGTTVCIYLPRHDGAWEPEAAADALSVQESGNGELVLVIDDEPSIRALVVELLREAGYRILEAEDGPSGLRVLEQAGRIDLLVTDVGLPGGMNGRQVADAARVAQPDLKVLFMTGYAQNAVVGNAHFEPWMQVLTKPFDMHSLVDKVGEMLAS